MFFLNDIIWNVELTISWFCCGCYDKLTDFWSLTKWCNCYLELWEDNNVLGDLHNLVLFVSLLHDIILNFKLKGFVCFGAWFECAKVCLLPPKVVCHLRPKQQVGEGNLGDINSNGIDGDNIVVFFYDVNYKRVPSSALPRLMLLLHYQSFLHDSAYDWFQCYVNAVSECRYLIDIFSIYPCHD